MDQQAKQQVIERIKSAENILVTVSTDPTVDQLAACIGTALMMNKLQKRGTAIYSGKTPSTIQFLQPEKTLETNTDSLRDFIISLDKNKADKLRYKIEDKFVRIYITPYRTSIGQKDLEFTQGDYNVDLVLALGVKDKAHVDAAIAAHGRILHDAPTISINCGEAKASDVGQINWIDPTASSLCEMMVSISEALGTGLIDNQTATAFLTGIVAETERFSNSKTTSKVMTMSAQLMAAGANQQLIAQKLAPPPPEPPAPPKPAPTPKKPKPAPPAPKDSGTITIDHNEKKKNDGELKISPNEIRIDERGNIEKAQELLRQAQEEAARKLQAQQSAAALPAMPTPAQAAAPAAATPAAGQTAAAPQGPIKTFRHDGGHDLFDMAKQTETPFSGVQEKEEFYDPMNADHKGDTVAPNQGFFSKAHDVQPPADFNPAAPPAAAPAAPVDSARNAVQSAYSSVPYNEARPEPIQALNAQPLGDLHPPAAPAAPAAQTPPAPQPNPAAPAPPPVPPPINFGQTPTLPTPQAPAQSQNGAVPSQTAPGSNWHM